MKILKKDFLKWLSKQPEERGFVFEAIRHCLLASFLIEKAGLKNVECGAITFNVERKERRMPEWMRRVSWLAARLDGCFTVADVRKILKIK